MSSSGSPEHEGLEAALRTELVQAAHEVAKEMLWEAALRDPLRLIVRHHLEAMLALLATAHEPEPKKKGK